MGRAGLVKKAPVMPAFIRVVPFLTCIVPRETKRNNAAP
jgi:hypothetical protein